MPLNIQLELSDEQLRIIALHIISTGMLDTLIDKKEIPLEEQLLPIKEVAQLTGLTTQTIHNHIKNGLIVAKKVGSQWRISRKSLKDYANGE